MYHEWRQMCLRKLNCKLKLQTILFFVILYLILLILIKCHINNANIAK